MDTKPTTPNPVTVTRSYFRLVDPDGRHADELRRIIQANRKPVKYLPLVMAAAARGNTVANAYLAAFCGIIAPERAETVMRAIRRAIRPTVNGRTAAC